VIQELTPELLTPYLTFQPITEIIAAKGREKEVIVMFNTNYLGDKRKE
jgi:hypothetical protein